MSALEKVAWTELLVSVVTVAVVTLLFPWLGSQAQAGFGLLGFLACGVWFVRRRGQAVIVDERDQAIAERATSLGVHAAWMVLFLSLIGIVLWSSTFNDKLVDASILTWLIWTQFALCYGVKGLVAVVMYRRQRFAS